jgi:hypothetical protein
MTRDAFTKAERRRLRELAGTAYERELGAALGALEAAFRAWRAGEFTAWDVGDRVHASHQEPSRRLYGLYHGLEPADAVARGLARGLLASGEVAPELRARLASRAAWYAPDDAPDETLEPPAT